MIFVITHVPLRCVNSIRYFAALGREIRRNQASRSVAELRPFACAVSKAVGVRAAAIKTSTKATSAFTRGAESDTSMARPLDLHVLTDGSLLQMRARSMPITEATPVI